VYLTVKTLFYLTVSKVRFTCTRRDSTRQL